MQGNQWTSIMHNLRIQEILEHFVTKWAAYTQLFVESYWGQRALTCKILVRLLELEDDEDYISFSTTHAFHKARHMPNPVWFQTLAYLTNIFSRINNLKLHFRARKQKFWKWNTKLNHSYKNFRFWEEKLKNNKTKYFNLLHYFPTKN